MPALPGTLAPLESIFASLITLVFAALVVVVTHMVWTGEREAQARAHARARDPAPRHDAGGLPPQDGRR